MRQPDPFTDHILDLLTPIGPIAARRMFGSTGLFLYGTMFALIVRDELFLKAGDSNRPDFEAAGEAPFSYETRNGTHILRSYWRCPAEAFDDPETLQQWARKAFGTAMAAAKASPPKARASPRR